MIESQVEGWDYNQSPVKDIADEIPFNFHVKPIDFLQQSYPLEPDMLFGWRPRLPLSPIPLTYRNDYVDWLVSSHHMDPKYKLVFLGQRPTNSVKVNQKYNYRWKTRSKYNLNIKVLKDQIQNVGRCGSRTRIVRQNVCPLRFNSSFESGNLDAVIQIHPDEYDCFIRSDSNTKGHCNWFYFSVTSSHKGPVRFNICNITKYANLYCKGMRPYVNEGFGWRQAGDHVVFEQASCRYGSYMKQHQLQFTYNFQISGQKVEFAYSIPYTYSKLQGFLCDIRKNYPDRVEIESLCDSLGGVEVPLITISDHRKTTKKVIMISGRMHPGQTVSSYVIQGFINSLLQNQEILSEFDFKIVPMLNPDGVIIGNFRTSYSGKDLNRQFYNLNKALYPEITALNSLAISLKKQYKNQFDYYFDMHGHSTKTNLFCYGPEYPRWSSFYLKCRTFAKIIEQKDELFSYKNSIFTISEHKKTTGRAKMFLHHQIPYTYTFQLSNGFYESFTGKRIPLDLEDMYRAGRIIFESFCQFQKVNLQMSNPNWKKMDNSQPRRASSRNIESACISQLRKIVRSDKRLKSSKKRKSRQNKSSSRIQPSKTLFQIDRLGLPDQQTLALQQILKQIQAETYHLVEEGGSDSQPEGEDLNHDQLADLHEQMIKRQIREVQDSSTKSVNAILSQKSNKITYKHTKQNTYEKPPNEIAKVQRSRRSLLTRSATTRFVRRKSAKAQPQKYLLIQKNFQLLL